MYLKKCEKCNIIDKKDNCQYIGWANNNELTCTHSWKDLKISQENSRNTKYNLHFDFVNRRFQNYHDLTVGNHNDMDFNDFNQVLEHIGFLIKTFPEYDFNNFQITCLKENDNNITNTNKKKIKLNFIYKNYVFKFIPITSVLPIEIIYEIKYNQTSFPMRSFLTDYYNINCLDDKNFYKNMSSQIEHFKKFKK